MDRLKTLFDKLDASAPWIAPLALRLLLAKEFWDAGYANLNGNNWFVSIQHQIPFPFSLFSVQFNWQLATSLEMIGALALILGLGTRFFAASFSLLILVAIYTVHAGQGYTIGTTMIESGWKLPLFYLVMLLPLVLNGPGKLSVDHLLYQRLMNTQRRLWS